MARAVGPGSGPGITLRRYARLLSLGPPTTTMSALFHEYADEGPEGFMSIRDGLMGIGMQIAR